MEYHLAIKRNEILIHATTEMNLERSQSHTQKIALIRNIQNRQIHNGREKSPGFHRIEGRRIIE